MLFLWLSAKDATYYNFQLFLGGRKILSVWPGTHRFVLPPAWTFNGRRVSLVHGVYRWFVFPAVGSHKARHYKPLLGWGSFVVG